LRLKDKVALVTGAAKGLGKEYAFALSKEGARVVLVDIDIETLTETADEIRNMGGQALAFKCDVSSREEVNLVVNETVKEFNSIDVLINNAQGMRGDISLIDITEEDMNLHLKSGLFGTLSFMQACFPYLKNGGKVINVASGVGLDGRSGWGAYAATKEAIRALTRVAAREWGEHQINVNCICPLAKTEWEDVILQNLESQGKKVPLGRLGDPQEDICGVVLFLSSKDSNFITGHTIMADGGNTILR
jgi:NAD(P)-dependent dehydrogenase (short-subunit alcohol dehydrogenase family)